MWTGTHGATIDSVVILRSLLDESNHIVVPSALKRRVLHLNHFPAPAGHPGSQRLYETMLLGFYWPSMVADVYHTVRNVRKGPRAIKKAYELS